MMKYTSSNGYGIVHLKSQLGFSMMIIPLKLIGLQVLTHPQIEPYAHCTIPLLVYDVFIVGIINDIPTIIYSQNVHL